MVKWVQVFLALALYSLQALAAKGITPSSPSQYCFYEVYTSLSSLTWESSKQSSRRSKSSSTSTAGCSSIVEVTSLYASSKLYCGTDFDSGLVFWRELCQKSGTTLISLTNVSATTTASYIASLPVVDPELNKTSSIVAPALLSRSYYDRAYRSYVDSLNVEPTNLRHGWALMGYWGGIVFLGIVSNIFGTINTARLAARRSDIEQNSSGFRRSAKVFAPFAFAVHLIKTHVTVPATFGTHHQRAVLWCTVPKRLDAMIVFGYWSLMIILACVEIDGFQGNTITPSVSLQIWMVLSKRTGIMCFACLPWIWMFAGRNNIFIWATGWNFRRFNIFHRHIARACTVSAIVHAIAYTVRYTIYDSRYKATLSLHYFYMGIVAVVLMCLLIPFSSKYLRTKYYEMFLLIHICFCIVIVYALFSHATKFESKGYKGYLWPIAAIWSFDRFLRLARIAYCNFHVRFSGQVVATSSTVVTYNKERDVVKIVVQPGSSFLKPGPGQYYHLYQPFTLRGWENHPFTLGAYSTGSSNPESETNVRLPTSSDTFLTFWVRPYDGWTKRLRDQCNTHSGVIHPHILLEGPYGHAPSLHSYDTVVMIMGGTGISSAVSHIYDHIARVAKGSTRTTRIHLVWTTKQRAFIEEVCQQELAGPLQRKDVEGSFFYSDMHTGDTIEAVAASPSAGSSAASSPIAAIDEPKMPWSSVSGDSSTNLDLHCGRPNISAIVSAAAAEATLTATRVVVVSCGPASMADAARAAVHTELRRGCREIDYVEDSFGW